MILVIVLVLIIIVVLGIIFKDMVDKEKKKKREKKKAAAALEEYSGTGPDTRSTSEKAADLMDTRGANTESQSQLENQLETGIAPEDAPSSGLTATDKALIALTAAELASDIRDQVAERRVKTTETTRNQRITKNILNKTAEKASRPTERLGMKVITRAAERTAMKTASKAAARAGTQMATKLTAAAATGPGAPFVLAAEMAFATVSGALDGLNAGGFNNLTTMSTLNDMRDTVEDYFVKENGSDIPLVYGPLDKLTDDEYDKLMIKKQDELIAKDPPPSTGGSDEYYNKKADDAFSSVCTEKGGVIFKHPTKNINMCSFPESKCVPPWPLQAGDTYYEYKGGVCQVRPSVMRDHCEKMGMDVSYNKDTGSCNLTEKYCGRYAGSARIKNGDCEINKAQSIAESIFGTTITRSIINIFDFENNYESCPPGTSEATELVLAGLGPLATQYFCSGSKCKDDEEMMMETQGFSVDLGEHFRQTGELFQGNAQNYGDQFSKKTLGGLCYPKCKDGYVSYWGKDRASSEVAGMCYKQCGPDRDPSVGFCTRLLDVKSDPGVTAKCPSGYKTTVEGPGGMCQPGCPSDYPVEQAGLCYKSSVKKLPGGAVNTTIPSTFGSCPGGYRTEPATCFKDAKCRTFWRTGTGVVTQCSKPESISRPSSCSDGYSPTTAGLCQAQTKSAGVAKSLLQVGTCPDSGRTYPSNHPKAGQKIVLERVGGMCYLPCDYYGGSYKRQGVSCAKETLSERRDSYSRTPKGPAYRAFPKKRKTNFPSTSEEDFKNSTIGKYVQGGINAIRNGDPKGLGKAMGGLMLTANPFTLSSGSQDLMDLGYQQVIS